MNPSNKQLPTLIVGTNQVVDVLTGSDEISAAQHSEIVEAEEGWDFEAMEANIRIYIMTPLCVLGVIINVLSIGVLIRNKLRLQKLLIQLFIFLNTFDA